MGTNFTLTSYNKSMKRYLLAILALALVSCNLPDPQEAARLKTDNETLLAQVSTLTKERDTAVLERDDLQKRLEQIKSALENLPTTTPAPVAPTAPATPDSSAATPAMPDSSTATPAMPDSSPTAPPTSSTTPDTKIVPTPPDASTSSAIPATIPDATALEKLQKYADDVLTAAQNFKAQTRQEAPSNCIGGYAAGAYNVQNSLKLKECSIVAEANGDYRVAARDENGNSVSVP